MIPTTDIRNRSTGEIINEYQLRKNNPYTSFPKIITDEILDSYGYDRIFDGPHPSISNRYQTIERSGVIEIEGKWCVNYVIGPIFNDYTNEDGILVTAQEQEEEHIRVIDENEKQSVRSMRDGRLEETDWIAIKALESGQEIPLEWKVYRQELRDITLQEGFPYDVIWPELP